MSQEEVQAGLLKRKDLPEVLSFYQRYAPYGLKYPRDDSWVEKNLGDTFFLIGARFHEILVGITWVAVREHRPYFTVEQACLVLNDGGRYVEVGGTLVLEEFRRKHVNDLLCASGQVYGFAWPTGALAGTQELWARVTGKHDENGRPLFWVLVGEPTTGISYDELLDQPFDAPERIILERWPDRPIPLAELPPVIEKGVIGKPADELVSYQRLFPAWGFHPTDQYAVNSLNAWCRCQQREGHIPKFFVSRSRIAILFEER